MKKYIQFYILSTGYVKGTIPPRFDGPQVPVPALGSDSVIIPDGRLSDSSVYYLAKYEAVKRRYIGFSIERSDNFREPRGKLILI